MENLIALFTDAGISAAIVAVATVLLTGIIKLPIKKLAAKCGNPEKVTRFIVFLPLICGFCLTALVDFALGKVNFDGAFFMRWLSAVSLSLTVYAFWEKCSDKKFLSESEVRQNLQAIEQIQKILTAKLNCVQDGTDPKEAIIPSNGAEKRGEECGGKADGAAIAQAITPDGADRATAITSDAKPEAQDERLLPVVYKPREY